MDKKKRFDARAFVVRTALAVVIAALSLGLTGCGKQMARIEENQLRLQALVELNAQQTSAIAECIELNQQDLQDVLENIRNSAERLGVDIAAVAGEHAKLQKMVQANDRQMTDKIAMVEQKQQNLQAGIEDAHSGTRNVAADIAVVGNKQAKLEQMIENNSRTLVSKVAAIQQNQDKLRAEIENVQGGTERVAADLAAVAEAQAKLEEMMQTDGQQMAGKVAVIEQNQLKRQSEIESIRNSVRDVAASVGALEENLLKFHELLRNDTRNLADIIEVIGQGQIEFEGKIERDVRGLADSTSAVEQKQAKLQKQVQEVQSSTQAMINNIMTTLDQLKARASRVRSAEPAKTAKTEVSVSEVKKQD